MTLEPMRRKDLGREMARLTHMPVAAAQDRVDEIVHEILRRLRAREPVDLAQLEQRAGGGRRLKAQPAGGE
jgi:hypothetical protein